MNSNQWFSLPKIVPTRQPIGPTERIVVDIGCATWEKPNGLVEDSILTLISRFHPRILFGFDPQPDMADGMGMVEGTLVLTSQRTAWTFNGSEGYTFDGNCSHVGGEDAQTACFDLASFLKSLPGVETIVKVDIEGAEYVLLPHLINGDALRNVSLLLVEWHDGKYRNGFEGWEKERILDQLSCPVEDWH